MNSGVIQFLLGTSLAAFLFWLIEPVTRRCKEACNRFDARQRTAEPAGEGAAGPSRSVGHEGPAPESPSRGPRARDYLAQAFSGAGLLGLIFLAILALAVPFNVQLLADSFALVLDRAGIVLFETNIFDVEAGITDLDLFAALLALNLLVLGAVYAHAREAGWNAGIRRIALLTLLLVCAFEISTTAARGYSIAIESGRDPLALAALSALQAYLCATAEVLAGYFSIHQFLLPLTLALALAWAVAAPFRMLAAHLKESGAGGSTGAGDIPFLGIVSVGGAAYQQVFAAEQEERKGRKVRKITLTGGPTSSPRQRIEARQSVSH